MSQCLTCVSVIKGEEPGPTPLVEIHGYFGPISFCHF